MFDDWFEHVILLLILIFILVGAYGVQPGIIIISFISLIVNVIAFILRTFITLATSSLYGFMIALALAYLLALNKNIVDWKGVAWIVLLVSILILIV